MIQRLLAADTSGRHRFSGVGVLLATATNSALASAEMAERMLSEVRSVLPQVHVLSARVVAGDRIDFVVPFHGMLVHAYM